MLCDAPPGIIAHGGHRLGPLSELRLHRRFDLLDHRRRCQQDRAATAILNAHGDGEARHTVLYIMRSFGPEIEHPRVKPCTGLVKTGTGTIAAAR